MTHADFKSNLNQNMPSGGRRPGAGRPKGATGKTTKLTREILAKAAAQNLSPLEFILQNMRRHIRARRWDEAERSAIAAAPYMHPKLAATTITGRLSLANMTDDELRAFNDEAEQALGIAPGERDLPPGAGTTKH